MGHPICIDSKNGKIVRIRPLHYDEKQPWESLNPWTIEARGKSFTVPRKAPVPPYCLTYKNSIYAPDRIRFPAKRVDWEPGGVNVNPQNRGKSKYKRISWDEASEIVASEVKRIHDKYGLWGILVQSDGHGESKNFAGRHGSQGTLLSRLGGYCGLNRNPDSWEGWVWGAKHVWGMEGVGKMVDHTNVWTDALRNTELIVDWGDGETTPWGGGMIGMNSQLLYWIRDAGIEHVFVQPGLNYTADHHADKWIPILPNTDTAFLAALSYVWITEGIYDEDFVRDTNYCIGFDKWEDYVLGDEDGVPKTPEWAAERCGVPAYTIKAFARHWAEKVTSFAGSNFGPGFRGPYSSEPARMVVYSLAMQGLGTPGVYQLTYIEVGMMGLPGAYLVPGVGGQMWGMEMVTVENPRQPIGGMGMLQEQFIPKPIYHEAILQHPTADNPITWYCMDHCTREEQFVKFQYPVEGYSNFHMIWMSSSCITTCWQSGFLHTQALRDPSIECIVAQHMVHEDDTLYADILLPEVRKLEVDDIMTDANAMFNVLILERKSVEPQGEAKSSVEVVEEVAKKLEQYGGIYTDAHENFTKGYGYEDSLKYGFEEGLTDAAKALVGSWEDFQDRQFYVFPVDPDWEARGFGGLAAFRSDPATNPLTTQTGKIEFECQDIKEHMPDDRERPPVAHHMVGGPDWTHNESLEGTRADDFPLLIASCHPRWREHAQTNDAAWLREIRWCKMRGPDGYMYEPIWMHPTDADARGIVTGDIVKMYNDRGICLGCAIVTERIMPGAVWQDHGANIDVIRDSGPDTLGIERSGANNMIAMRWGVSQNCTAGMASSGYLVECEKLSLDEMEQWKKDYPDAFERKYDYDSGQCFDAWVVDEGGMD